MMTTMVQVRSVPRDLHRRLKIRAASEGVSMSTYVLRELRKSLDRPIRAEVLERLQARPVRRIKQRAADLVRLERDAK
ncbi:MAG: toxin-antitoxin system HicB family antitoxin [Pseudomonadota bacterium]